MREREREKERKNERERERESRLPKGKQGEGSARSRLESHTLFLKMSSSGCSYFSDHLQVSFISDADFHSFQFCSAVICLLNAL